MDITTFASGSTGNCTLVSSMGTHILIDAGISMRRIKNALGTMNLTPSDISGIFITHEHNDHIGGLEMMCKHYELPVFAPPTVANHLRWSKPRTDELICEIRVGMDYDIGELSFRAFNTPHDTPQSVGYRVQGDAVLGYCTDLGHVNSEIYENLFDADICLLESNHDVDMLRYGSYPAFLKRRVLSDNGHLSNSCCAKTASRLLTEGKLKSLILAHLSRENNLPDLAYNTVCTELLQKGAVIGRDIDVCVAPADRVLTASMARSSTVAHS